MGNLETRVKGWLKPKSFRVLIIGLDAAGKTSLLYKLKLGEVVTTIPTIGFNVETVPHAKHELVMWDVGGRNAMRNATGLIRHYLDNTQGLVLCVDSADQERMEEVKEYMTGVLGHEVCDGVPLLVMANKQDLGGAMSPKEVEGALRMDQLRGRPWAVMGSCMPQGQGLEEGLNWLHSEMVQRQMGKTLFKPVVETVEDGQKVALSSWLFSWLSCGKFRAEEGSDDSQTIVV